MIIIDMLLGFLNFIKFVFFGTHWIIGLAIIIGMFVIANLIENL